MAIRAVARLAAIAAVIWLQSAAAAAQSAPSTSGKIAYDQCNYDYDWYLWCEIHVWTDGVDTFTASGGLRPKWSPDGNRILFEGPGIGGGVILLLNVGDGSVISLTDYPPQDYTPVWSSDGTKIAFASNRTGALELYSISHDGTDTVRLTNAIGFTGEFAWAAVSNTIALVGELEGVRYLYTVKADGSNLRRLTSSVGFNGLAWSPVGSTIAFTRYINGISDLYKINDDGSNLVRLTSAVASGRLAWSPDGTRIAFNCAQQVCVINQDGTGLSHLTDGYGAVFAPDGVRIAFVQGSEILVRERDGTIIRVAPGITGFGPVWSSDGARLLFQSGPVGYQGCCSDGCHADLPACLISYISYVANADGSGLQAAFGNNPDWFQPHAGQPLASFTDQCTGSSCLFDAAGSSDPDGDIVSYTWRFGDGTGATGATANHKYTIGGRYMVTLTVVDNSGLISIVGRTVTANAPPIASFSAVCSAGGVCTFDGTRSADPDGSIVSYYWDFGDRHSSSGPTATNSYVSGTFIVQLTVTDNAGATATASTTLQIVNAPPMASFGWVCNALICTFDATTSKDDGSLSFWWDFGDRTGDLGAITIHTYAAEGTYPVVLTVADDAGQQAAVRHDVTAVRGAMHVGDLDAYTSGLTRGSVLLYVTVTVHDQDHRPVGNATVYGSWSSGDTSACTTSSTGQCNVSLSIAIKKGTSVSFSVRDVTQMRYVYQPSMNHDPDRDSDGTMIVIKQP
jgi:PKD repeat protein